MRLNKYDLTKDDYMTVAVKKEIEEAIDDSIGFKTIPLRLDKSLLEDYLQLAEFKGVNYHSLMLKALNQFADFEKSKILRHVVFDMKKSRDEKD